MTTTYRIAEVADRSGFTPATLRYYEDIGLVAPAGRSDAGYRVYDESSLVRLRFIARAKQLGCSLDEIADLVSVWDDGTCAHVQARLRDTVAAKIAAAHDQITDLTSLTADLRRAAAALRAPSPPGPCGDDCGCLDDPAPPGPVAVSLTAGPSSPPIACTLDPAQAGSRAAAWATLLDQADGDGAGVVQRAAIAGGVRLTFGPGADVAAIARLAAAEQECCAFFRFALTIDDRGVALEARAPDGAADILTALFATPA